MLCLSLQAQNPTDSLPKASDLSNVRITGDYRGIPIVEVLVVLRDRYGIQFYFDPNLLPQYTVNIQFTGQPFLEAMRQLFDGTNLVAAQIQRGKAIIAPKTNLTRQYANDILAAWDAGTMHWPQRKLYKEMTLTFGNATKADASKSLVFKGKITDENSGEAIAGVILRKAKTQDGSTTDGDGKFEWNLKTGEHDIDIQFVGYQTTQLKLFLYENASANFEMNQMETSLSEVIVRAKADNANVRSTQVGVENLSVKRIKELPTALGEADVIKTLQTLPGVSTVGEGAAGFNVRGGNIDQNLIVQDGAPIFNTAHALGFFSAFNPDVIGEVTLFKGGIPAQYGGRLSSVLDVRIKDGNFQNWHGTGGLGLAYSRLAIEGPLWRNRTSIIIGGRLSYSDWMLKSVADEKVRTSKLSFQDLTGKITQRIGEQHSVSLSGFQSGDFFQYAQDFGYEWQTQLATLSWNFLASDKLSSSFKAIAGDYQSVLFEPAGNASFRLENGLKYYVLKENIFYQINADYQFNTGIEWTRYEAKPERLRPYNPDSKITSQTIAKDLGEEAALYVNAEIKINTRWSLSAGLRYARYQQLGPREVYRYALEVPRTSDAIVDTTRYANGDAIQTYDGWEPRLSLKYALGQNSSIKLGYNRLWQYIHLISNTSAATPVDFWQVSTTYIPPQSTHNFSLGYFQNLNKDRWQLSLEIYYKNLKNLLTYKDLPSLLLNNKIETELLPSQGKAYGVEMAVRKTAGKWNGFLSYTYARTLQRTADAFPSERVNGGDWFAANFDQPHQINLILKRQPNPVLSFIFSFTYKTGRPFTVPTSNYSVGGIVISQYAPRNEDRIPAYHRLDFTVNVDKTTTKDKGFRSSFTFSIYNLYFHKNAFSVYFKRNPFNQSEAYRLALIGTALPAFTWNFLF